MGPFRSSPAPPGSPGPCPRCEEIDLEVRAVGAVRIGACRSCRGFWVAGPAFIHLFAGPEDELRRLARADAEQPTDHPGEARCPRCRRVMERQVGASRVTLDSCDRHGAWFDAGELRAVLAHAGIDADGDDDPPGWLERLAAWLTRAGGAGPR